MRGFVEKHPSRAAPQRAARPYDRAMKHLDEAKTLWAEIVPKSGQAKTQQGEMLRASEKLRDSWFREGNGYWDKDYEHFVAYLREHLTAEESFSADQKRQVNEDLDTIADHESGEMAEEHFDRLTDLVVEWIHAHPEPVTHEEIPDLER